MSLIRSDCLEQLGIFVGLQILRASDLWTGSAMTCLEIENLLKSNLHWIFFVYISVVYLVTMLWWSAVHCLHLPYSKWIENGCWIRKQTTYRKSIASVV